MTMRGLSIAAAIALTVFGCASGPSTRNLDAGDDGRNVELKVGDELVVKLAANRSTGYRWVLTQGPGKVLFKQGDPLYARPVDAPVGAGGIETWSFRAVEAGEQPLVFEYRRPSDKSSDKSVSYKVIVR
jgi:predicted secreted protein